MGGRYCVLRLSGRICKVGRDDTYEASDDRNSEISVVPPPRQLYPSNTAIITQSNSQRGVKFCTIDDWCLFDDYLDLGCACLGNAKIPLIVVRYSNYRQLMLMLTQPRSNTNIFSDNGKITWYYGFLNVHSESDPLTQVYQ